MYLLSAFLVKLFEGAAVVLLSTLALAFFSGAIS